MALIFTIATGFRSSVVLLLAGPVIMHYYLTPKRKFIFLKIAMVAAIITIFISISSYLRYADVYQSEKSDKIYLIDALTKRSCFENLWAVVNLFPHSHPYYSGITYFDMMVLRFIPRAIWPDKPSVYGSDRIVESLIKSVSVYHVQAAVPMPAELYANFGLTGIFIGGFLWGLFLKSVYLYFRRNQYPLSVAVYASFYGGILPLIEFAFTFLVNWSIGMIFFYLISRIVARKNNLHKPSSLSEKSDFKTYCHVINKKKNNNYISSYCRRC